MASLFRSCLVAIAAWLVSGGYAGAHEGEGEGRGRSAHLTPPDGAPFPKARGQVVLTQSFLLLKVKGLGVGDYQVLLDDGKGTLTAIGTIAVKAENRDGDEDEGEEKAKGRLKLEGAALPFGVASPLDLAGRAINVNDKDGKVVLQGKTPSPIVKPPVDLRARCPLSRPDPAVDADAEGAIKLESGGGRIAIKVHLDNLDNGKIYEVILTNPADNASQSLGKVTIDDDGDGKLKLDTAKGDAIPFGAGDLKALEGFGVKVNNPEGAAVLVGTICPAQVHPGKKPEGDHEKECEAPLNRPDPAPDADASGEVEFSSQKLEVEAKHLEASATYDVVLTNPADSSAQTAGQIQTNAFGAGELEVKAETGKTLEFGGFAVAVKDAKGAVVLQGTVPTGDCPKVEGDRDGDGRDGDEGRSSGHGGGGGALVAPVDEPMFLMSGDFDAPFLRGDANRDDSIDVSDAVGILLYLFVGSERPYCLDASDANDDGQVDIGDPIALMLFLFTGGKAPPAPGTFIPGSDPTADDLYCQDPVSAP